MFSRSAATSLRDSIAAGKPDRDLVTQYCSHYGLEFGSVASHDFQFLDSAGHQVILQRFSLPIAQQKGTAFLLHGYFDHVGLFGKLIAHCLRRGFSVVIADWPGHGLSSGPQADIDSFARYCQVLTDSLNASDGVANRPWLCIGQSTGAAVLVDALLHHGLNRSFDISRIVLLAPLLRTAHWWRSKLGFAVARWFVPRIQRNFSLNSHDDAFREFLKHSDELQSKVIPRSWIAAMMEFEKRFQRSGPLSYPVHIIQGTGDTTVDWQYNLPRLEQKFPGTTSYLVADARHHLVNEAPDYRDRVFTLLSEILDEI